MSTREADTVRHDWNGGVEAALSDVDRSGPVVDGAQVSTLTRMDLQVTLPEGDASTRWLHERRWRG